MSNIFFSATNELTHALLNRLKPSVMLTDGVMLDTAFGRYEVPIQLTDTMGRTIGICFELTVAEASLNEWKAAVLVGSHLLDAVYFVRARGLVWTHPDLLMTLMIYEPDLFQQRFLDQATPISPMVKAQLDDVPRLAVSVWYSVDSPDCYFAVSPCRATDRETTHWRKLWAYCRRSTGRLLNLQALIERYPTDAQTSYR